MNEDHEYNSDAFCHKCAGTCLMEEHLSQLQKAWRFAGLPDWTLPDLEDKKVTAIKPNYTATLADWWTIQDQTDWPTMGEFQQAEYTASPLIVYSSNTTFEDAGVTWTIAGATTAQMLTTDFLPVMTSTSGTFTWVK